MGEVSTGSRSCRDFIRELFDLSLQAAHFLQRAFRHQGKHLWVLWQNFSPEMPERLVHQFQHLNGLSETFGFFAHNSIRNMPLRTDASSRERLTNST